MSPFFFFFFFIYLFLFSALEPEQDLNLAQLAEADVKETSESSKKHTYDLLKKIREHLSSIGMEAAALPEDQAQKYFLAVSNSNVNWLLFAKSCRSVSNSNFSF